MKFNLTTTVSGILIVTALFLFSDRPGRFAQRPPPSPPVVAAPAPAAPAEAAAPATEEHSDTVESLPPGPGREETFYACAACHGLAIVTQQGMTRNQWDASIDWMIERHGMPPLEQAERDVILDYLVAQFPPRATRGRDNPFLRRN